MPAGQDRDLYYGMNARRPTLGRETSRVLALPLVVFVAASGLFAFLWQSMPPSVLALLCVLLVGLPMSVSAARVKAGPAAGGGLLQMGLALLALVTGVLTGVFAYETFMGPFYTIALGQRYENVVASTSGAAYSDAGRIIFANSSAVNQQLSLGFRESPTYCVAPITDGGDSASRMVTFWAIGLNCCAARGSFSCNLGDGDDSGARGGVRASSDGIFAQSHRQFMRAIAQAAAVSDLVVDTEPILLHWTEDPGRLQTGLLLKAIGVLILGTVLFALLSVATLGASSAYWSIV